MRAVTVVCMIAVHATWYMAAGGQWLASGAILVLLHYTRESFMMLTGFVLTYSLFGRPVRWTSVLCKRYRLILFPYMLWTAVYMLAFKHYPDFSLFALSYGHNLWDGDGWFHLYYLLITMQFYLCLPLFFLLMRIAQRRPVAVGLGAVIFELALTTYDQYAMGPHPQGLNAHIGMEVWTYTAYLVLGGVAALYWPSIRVWLHDQLTGITITAGGAALFTLAQFFIQARAAGNLVRADAVIQPAMVPWTLSVMMLLAALGVRYEDARHRVPQRWQAIKWVADFSFGLYLIHPLLLQLWASLLARMQWYHPSYVLDTSTVVLLVLTSGALAHMIAGTPLSVWIIGRAEINRGVGRALVAAVWPFTHNRVTWTWARPRRKPR